MNSTVPCRLGQYLRIVPGKRDDYEQLSHFHYHSGAVGPIRAVYKLIDTHGWRRLAAPVVGVIVYGSPSANLAGRNAATGGLFSRLDRSAALSLLNERMVCIRRVIIDPRYRGLGLASRLVSETMPLTGAAMVEAVSVMGRAHPFFERAGMRPYLTQRDAKTERMAAALEAVGIGTHVWHDSAAVHKAIDAMDSRSRQFIFRELDRFCQKFTNRRQLPDSPQRTSFVLSKLDSPGVYYLWYADPK